MRRILLTLLIAISSVLAIQAQGDVTGGATVVRAEYFFDSDPGYGNATIINNVTSGDNNLSLSVDGLSPGAHMLYVRSQASSGVWSSTQSHPLLLIRQRPTEAVRVEYFYDTDPGYGNGKSVGNLVDGDNTLVFSVEGLAYGVHHLCLRAQDNTGVWSQVATSSIFVASPKTANAVRIEYFFDTDPGYGQATAITPSQDETATYALSLDNLSMGAHMLYLRVQDNHGRWSAVQKHPIYVLSNLPDVVAAEYFFDDNDPGEGQATAVPLPSVKTEPFAFEANTEGLAPGEHHLKVRLKKNNGFWTLYDAATFTVEGVAEPEPYAVLSEDNTVLTFYYDDQKDARNGMSVGPFDYPDYQVWYAQRESITKAIFDPSFAKCTSLTSTAYWFNGCKNLTSIVDINNLKTDNVIDMSWMFSDCYGLKSLDVSSFNTDNVTDMEGIVAGCSGLTSIDVSGFKTENVTSMSCMFIACSGLTSLDLSNFNTANVTNMMYMFSSCTELTTIYAGSEWNTASIVEYGGGNMFEDCINLVGGKGTVYDANHTDYIYAHIDGGVSNPGYFTDKNGSTLNDGDTFTAVNSDGIELRYRVISAADKTCQVGDRADGNTLSSYDLASAVDTTVVGVINVPEQANGYKVVRVGYQAFVNCRYVTEVVLPNTVTQVYLYSFGYSGIKRFILPRSVSIIDYAALVKADSLETIIVDSENPVFDSRNNCNAIIETASNTLVRGCITSFVPDGITTIGSGAFISCRAHDWTIELPNSVTRIETQAFNSCDLTDIKLSNNLQYVGYSAFGGSKLTSVVVPASVTEMGIGAFRVNSLTSLVVDEANSVFDSRDNCNAIIETATNTLVCGLPVTIIPNSVTAIGRDAFRELWNLNTITLPSSITRIDDHAFWFSNLDTIISLIEKPFEISDKVFYEDLYKRCELYVPAGTVDAYRSTSGWNLFQNILEINPSHGGPEPYAVLSDNNTVLTFYYDNQKEVRNGMSVGPFDNEANREWNDKAIGITKVVFDSTFAEFKPTSTKHWFNNFQILTSIDNMNYLNTSEVDNMEEMFINCQSLTNIDLSGFNTAKVKNMRGMFYNCYNLTKLDVSSFNTENVESMMYMFHACRSLTSLDVSNFNTSNVSDWFMMFMLCESLTELDVSGFDVRNTNNVGELFRHCFNLKSVKLFSVNGIEWPMDINRMFDGCSKLRTIYADSSWDSIEKTGDYAFDGCTSLVGGKGTVYDANHIDYTYAHIDGGVSNPGYFTDKNDSTLNDGDTFTAVNSDGIKLRYRVISAADKTCQVGDKADSNTLSPDDIASAVDTTVVGVINVPEQANGYKVVRVGYQAFVRCRNVTEVVLPNTVTELYLYSFAHSGIKRFTLPRSVSIIHYAALTETDSLETIIVDSENPLFDSRNNCNAIIETASNTLVRGCITSFVPDGITTIGSGAFLSCCAHDWTIELPNSVTRIETQAFNSCDLTDIKLPNNLQYVGYAAFGGSKLTSIVVPASVTEMGIGAFRVNSLTSLVVDEANSVFDSRDNCNAIIETATNTLVCGSNVTIIPNSVTAIGRYAFSELWNLKTITFPSSITRIDDHAFWFSNLETIISLIEKPFEISDNVFREDVYKRCALNVPTGTVDAYRSTPCWNLFQNIVEMTPSYVSTFSADGVLTISNEMPMTDALEAVGGRAEVAKTITAIVWNNTFPLTNSDLQGLDNPNMLIYVNSSELAPANRYNVVIGDFAKNIVLTDVSEGNGNFYCPQAFTAEKVNYVREFRQQTVVGVSRGWESIALPFTVQTISHEKQGAIAPFGNSASKKHFWLRRLGDSGLTQATVIEANIPYIISMPNDNVNYAEEFNLSGRVTFAAQEVTIPVTEPVTLALADSTIKMVPAFHGIGRASDVWAINVGESRDQYLEGSVFERDYREVRPFEAYTVHTGEGPAPRFVLITEIGGTTGIEDVRGLMSDGRGDKWYDLNGRRLQQKPTQKGVYLNNGRKVIIR